MAVPAAAAAAAGGAKGAGTAATVASAAQAAGTALSGSGLFRASLKKQERAAKRMADYNAKIADRQAEEAWKRTLELNQIQYEQNSYPTLMKQLEEAGLNKSMAYGASQAGGAGGGSAPQASSTGGQTPDIAALQNAGSMALTAGGGTIAEIQRIINETKMAEANANKANAEADSIRGEEGTIGNAQIKNLAQDTLNKKQENTAIKLDNEMQEMINELKGKTMPYEEEEWEYKIEMMVEQWNYMQRQTDIADVEKEIKERTKENQIRTVGENLNNIVARTIETYTQANLNDRERQAIGQHVGMAIANGQTRLLEIEVQKYLGEMGIQAANDRNFINAVTDIGNSFIGAIGHMENGKEIGKGMSQQTGSYEETATTSTTPSGEKVTKRWGSNRNVTSK